MDLDVGDRAALRRLQHDWQRQIDAVQWHVNADAQGGTDTDHARLDTMHRWLGDLEELLSPVEVIAERIARAAHQGQTEESTGDDYIHHLERVVALVDGEDAKAVAWLHDVLEDTNLRERDLVRAGFSDAVLDAVALLTRDDADTYATYIAMLKFSQNPLAMAVKRADLQDHLRPNCPARLRPRYEAALQVLGAVSDEVVVAASCDHEFTLMAWKNHEDGGRHCWKCGAFKAPGAVSDEQLRRPNGDTYAQLLEDWQAQDRALQDIYGLCATDAPITCPADVVTVVRHATASQLRQFAGFLSGDVPELHTVEVPRLGESVDRFLRALALRLFPH